MENGEKSDCPEKQILEKSGISASLNLKSGQPTMNILVIGHVTNGKSTLIKCVTGIPTIRFNPSGHLDFKPSYKNAKIYKCDNDHCEDPGNYCSKISDFFDAFPCHNCENGHMRLVKHVSFFDSPVHEKLISYILNGSISFDGIILVIAGNEEFPQQQTLESLAVVDLMMTNDVKLGKNFIVVQNKMDLLSEEAGILQYRSIMKFFSKSRFSRIPMSGFPVIPISAQLKHNMESVCKYISFFKEFRSQESNSNGRMNITRSYETNNPGTIIDNLQGGFIGGSIVSGMFQLGQRVEIRPGIAEKIPKEDEGEEWTANIRRFLHCTPLRTRIVSLQSEKNDLKEVAKGGGLVLFGTELDPTLTRGDRLVGQVVFGMPTEEEYDDDDVQKVVLFDVFDEIEVSYCLFKGIPGSEMFLKKSIYQISEPEKRAHVLFRLKRKEKVDEMKLDEKVVIHTGTNSVGGVVRNLEADLAKISLFGPICANLGDRITISRRIEYHWRLVGWGRIRHGRKVEIKYTVSK